VKPDHTLLSSLKHAFAGVWHVLRSQRNARIHLAAMVVAVALGTWIGLSRVEWLILALVVGMVLAAECFNTAAEATIDLVTEEHHPLAKIAKDAAAAGVLLTALVAVVVGVLILGIPLLHHLVRLLR
jgi:diacylglycerol kinase (ATP)